MPSINEEEFESALTKSMDLARIVETFMIELIDGGFVRGCLCCDFPTPTPFVNLESGELLCRTCRTAHDENGNHLD